MPSLFSSERALTVQSRAIPQLTGRPALVPLQLSGFEAINGLFGCRLALHSQDAYLSQGASVASALQGANFKLTEMRGPARQHARYPFTLIASPAGIDSTKPQTTQSTLRRAITSCGHCRVNAGKRWGANANESVRMFYYKTAASRHSTACAALLKAVIASINLLAKLIATAQSIHAMAKEEIVINGSGSLSNCKASGIEDATGIESVAIHVGIHPTKTLLYDAGSPQSFTSFKLMQISQMPA